MGIAVIVMIIHIPNLQIGRAGAWLMGLAALAIVAVGCGTDAGAASGPVVSNAGDVAAGTGEAANSLVSENSNSGQSAETLMLSPEVSDFTLPSGLGNDVTLSSFLGEQNVMIVFYRAWW